MRKAMGTFESCVLAAILSESSGARKRFFLLPPISLKPADPWRP
jgi:hypothetical protein